MSYFVLGNRCIDVSGAHPAQADMCSGGECECPRKTPAVAVKHWQRPQINRAISHPARKCVAITHQSGTAMMTNHALGIAGSAGRVIQRNRVPLIVRHRPIEIWISSGEKFLVIERRIEIPG